MVDFVPAGYLTISQAIDGVVELMQGGDASSLLTEDERATLRTWRDYLKRISRHVPEPVTPVPKVVVSRAVTDRAPHRHVEAEPRPPTVTAEEFKGLQRKEALFEEQRPAAKEVLRHCLYNGRVPSVIIADNGSLIETPEHIWGGVQWHEALRSNRVKFAQRLRRSRVRSALDPSGRSGGRVQPRRDCERGAGAYCARANCRRRGAGIDYAKTQPK